MTTIREHLEQQIREMDYWLDGQQATFGNLGLLRILREHAVAALAILDAAEREVGGAPDFASGETPTSTRYYTQRRLVADPEPAA